MVVQLVISPAAMFFLSGKHDDSRNNRESQLGKWHRMCAGTDFSTSNQFCWKFWLAVQIQFWSSESGSFYFMWIHWRPVQDNPASVGHKMDSCIVHTHIYIYILGLPTPKKYQSFCTIRRFIKFMVVWSVSPKRLGVVCHGCVSHRHGPPPSLLTSILLSIHTSKLVSV